MTIFRRFQGWLWQLKDRFYRWRNPTVVIHTGPIPTIGDYNSDIQSPVVWPD